MPRGREKTAPEVAKSHSEIAIFIELRKWPDGLRLTDLTNALKGKVHKNTIIARLKDLEKQDMISYDKGLKRYRIDAHGWDRIRQLEIINLIRISKEIKQSSILGAEKVGYSSSFIQYDESVTPRQSIGYKILQKRRDDFLDIWLREIFTLAKDEGLIHPEPTEDEKHFDKLSDITLERIWGKLFPIPQKILYVEMIDTAELFRWLKTPWGKVWLSEAINKASNHDRSLSMYLSSEQFLNEKKRRGLEG